MAAKSVALITMSLRPARIGSNVAAFIQPILQKTFSSADVKLVPVDLRDFNLPIFNENLAPASEWPVTESTPLFAREREVVISTVAQWIQLNDERSVPHDCQLPS